MTVSLESPGRGEEQSNCPFCNIEELVIVAETPKFLVAYNKFSIVRGHSLIVPKRHVVSYLLLEQDELFEIARFSQSIIAGILETYDTNSFDFALQEGVPAGGTIAHLHFHVIPRVIGDLQSPDDWYPELLKGQFDPSENERRLLNHDEMLKEAGVIADNIRRHL